MTHESSMPNLSARLERRRQLQIELERDRQRLLELTGPDAWVRLATVGKGDTHQSQHCRRILLSVYNGATWPLDPTRLRVIDRELQQAALTVIEWSIYSFNEPHDYTPGGNQLMQDFAIIEKKEP